MNRKKEITRLYEAGRTFEEIAQKLGITRRALFGWIERNGGKKTIVWNSPA